MLFLRILEAEAEFLTNLLHTLVFDKDGTSEALVFFVVAKLDQPTQQFGTQPLSQELVGDENGKLSLIFSMDFVLHYRDSWWSCISFKSTLCILSIGTLPFTSTSFCWLP
jgi:hypothetical protein